MRPILWSLLILTLAVVSCGKDHITNPGPAAPTIVFYSTRGGAWDLYAVYPDGAGFQRLTHDSLLMNMEPRWSPDGSKIVFVHQCDLVADSLNIEVINADGSNRTRLTHLQRWYDLREPTWSPDGSQIAYQVGYSYQQSNPNQLWVMNADGSPPHLVIDSDSLNGVTQITWTPKNTFLGIDYFSLVQFNADGSGRTTIFSSNNFIYAYPRMSPDGTKIVFAWPGPLPASENGTNIYVINADGTNPKQLTTDPGASYPVWSPNGKKIAYRGGDFRLWTMNADGSNKTLLPISDPNPGHMDLLGDWK